MCHVLPRAWGCSWVQRLCWQLGLHFSLRSRRVNKQNVYIQAPFPDSTWRHRTTSLPAATWPSPAGITPWGGRKAFCLRDVSGCRDRAGDSRHRQRCSAGCSPAFYGFGPVKLTHPPSSSPCTCCFHQSAYYSLFFPLHFPLTLFFLESFKIF